MTTILVILVCAITAIGIIVGLVKGYTKTRAWGGTVLFSVLLVRLICSQTEDMGGKGEFTLIATICFVLFFMLVFTLFKKLISKRVAMAQTKSEYQQHDEKEENTARILTALETGDTKTYNKSAKRKFKAKSGGWGFVNRICGAITVGLNSLLMIAMVISVVLTMVDFVRIDSLTEFFTEASSQPAWRDLGATLIFDLLIVTILYACIRIGFKGGISNALCAFVIVGLLVISGYVSYHLAFDVEVFINGANEIASGSLSETISSIAGVTSGIGLDEVTIGKIIIMCCLFLVFLIVIIVLGIFLPKIVEKFRGEKAFYIVDGVLGAIVLTAIVFALIAFLFGALHTISDLPAMYEFNGYIFSSPIANALYANNPLESWFGLFGQLPIRSWFVTETVE
jgi:hypothetical protein